MKNANKKSNNSKFWLKIYIKKRGVILLEQEINRWRLNGLDGKEKKSKEKVKSSLLSFGEEEEEDEWRVLLIQRLLIKVTKIKWH